MNESTDPYKIETDRSNNRLNLGYSDENARSRLKFIENNYY
ncbi:hypothetical protein [Chamaesiphon sp. VAR_48_metabat_403]|nr:hypothetical protein [Chamaesiphon sp. VAR_48_metabat_403]